jgi:hypothetical protein
MKRKSLLRTLFSLAALALIVLCGGCGEEQIERNWSSGESKQAGPFALQLYYNPSSPKAVSDFRLRVEVSRAGQPISNASVQASVSGPRNQTVTLSSTGGNTYEGVVDFSGSSSYWHVDILVSANGESGSTGSFRFYAG